MAFEQMNQFSGTGYQPGMLGGSGGFGTNLPWSQGSFGGSPWSQGGYGSNAPWLQGGIGSNVPWMRGNIGSPWMQSTFGNTPFGGMLGQNLGNVPGVSPFGGGLGMQGNLDYRVANIENVLGQIPYLVGLHHQVANFVQQYLPHHLNRVNLLEQAFSRLPNVGMTGMYGGLGANVGMPGLGAGLVGFGLGYAVGQNVNDEDIKLFVENIIDHDPRIPRRVDAKVDVDKGIVRLRGTVPHPILKALIYQAALQAPGIIDVINELHVDEAVSKRLAEQREQAVRASQGGPERGWQPSTTGRG